jgi:hypothetical protein
LGLQDLSIGTSTFTRATSTGGTQTLNQINSTNLGSGFPLNLSSPLTLTGVYSGGNTTYTLPTSPNVICMVFRNGLLQQGGGIDYTLTGTSLVFAGLNTTSDVVAVVY